MNRLRSAAAPVSRPPPIMCAQGGSAALIVVGILATACAVTTAALWIMHLTATSPGVPEFSKAVTFSKPSDTLQDADSRNALLRLFSATESAPTAGARPIEGVKLQGIVSDKRGTSVALFSIDGAPSVRLRPGERVRDGVTLVEIQRLQVLLEQGGRTVELKLPARATPQSAMVNTLQPKSDMGQMVPTFGTNPSGVAAPDSTVSPSAAPVKR